MNAHPSTSALTLLLSKYPKTSGTLFLVYNDVVHAQSWKDVESVDLGEQCLRGAIKGRRPNTDTNEPVYIVPCALAETVSYAWLHSAFKSLSDSSEICLGMTADDSSIVYYKISSGIVKPPGLVSSGCRGNASSE
ncbi:Sen15 protein-domain-containing protein [Armillaria luteobubalina]|uniref:Sen15 protein-domain-containing protein n=1 Tax=Armillaria luteobubalina TaxID=153913 RepID=A0AA39PB54_9AGAR|nr:Sen15 protein-domain-containing protein [Armillaria luteobubalina]